MHKYENLEKKWFFYKIKRFFIIYLAPILVVVAGVGIYFWFIYSVHPGEEKAEYQKTTQNTVDEKKFKMPPMGPGPVIIPKEQLEKIEKEQNLSAQSVSTNTVQADENVVQNTDANVTQETTKPVAPEKPESLEGQKCYKVVVPALNVRSKPTTAAEVIGKARQGDIVCQEERAGDWIRTKKGWIFGKNFISPLPKTYEPFKEVKEPESKPAPIDVQKALPETKSETPKKIDMTSQSIDPRTQLERLKQNYSSAPSYKKALEVAETYYIMQDYISSKDWALKANDLNSDDPGSWVAFAKSLDKLGKNKEAINVLSSYLKTHDSVEAETLLKNLRN